MNQAEGLPPGVPPSVLRRLEEVRQLHMGEPQLQRINDRHWRITLAIPRSSGEEEVVITLDVMVARSGRVTSTSASIVYGRDISTGHELGGWDEFLAFTATNMGGPNVPVMPSERSVEQAPALVRREYEAFLRAVGSTATVRVGFEDQHWVIGVDRPPCDCGGSPCPHDYILRMYFYRTSKKSPWKPDIKRFFLMTRGVDCSDRWRNQQREMAALLAGGVSDPSATIHHPSGPISRRPAGEANSEAVRKNTVRRI